MPKPVNKRGKPRKNPSELRHSYRRMVGLSPAIVDRIAELAKREKRTILAQIELILENYLEQNTSKLPSEM